MKHKLFILLLFISLKLSAQDSLSQTFVSQKYRGGTEAFITEISSQLSYSKAAKENNYSVLLTADHGNSDNAINADGSPNTAHSLNKVPVFIINSQYSEMENGCLADIAPTMLSIMGIDIPKAMTGNVLVK